METTTQVQTAIIISPGNYARFLAVVTFLVSLLLDCAGLTGIECPTFSKLQFEFDPLWHVSSSCKTEMEVFSLADDLIRNQCLQNRF